SWVARIFPSFAKEGWTRPKEKCREAPLKGADGVVVSSCRLSRSDGFDKRWLETTTPSAPLRKGAVFFMAQPPLLCEGGECLLACCLSFQRHASSISSIQVTLIRLFPGCRVRYPFVCILCIACAGGSKFGPRIPMFCKKNCRPPICFF